MKIKLILTCITFIGYLMTFTGYAAAATYTLTATDSGWYTTVNGHNPDNNNFIVGNCCGDGEHRNFFVFDLSGVSGNITSATLEIETRSISTPDPSETWALYDISTPIATLIAGGISASIFTDLGSGTSYGNVTVANDYKGIVSVSLNASAVVALNTAKGTSFALGGAITTLGGAYDEYIFGNSESDHIRRLTLQTNDFTAIPTMTEWGMIIFMMFAGLGAAYYLRRQRRLER